MVSLGIVFYLRSYNAQEDIKDSICIMVLRGEWLNFGCLYHSSSQTQGWSAASFEWKVFYAVTPGQPVPEQCLGTSFTDIFFLAGRKKSKLIRDTFMDHVDTSQTLNSLNHRSMNKLNLALMVTLSFGSASTIDPIRIGQGSSFFRNDWWIGGEGCKRKCFYEDTDGSEKFILQCGELCFSPTGDLDASRFDVKRVPCCDSDASIQALVIYAHAISMCSPIHSSCRTG